MKSYIVENGNNTINKEYIQLLNTIKQEITVTQHRAMVKVNTEMILMYFSIGKHISEHKTWGSRLSKVLSKDIELQFPDIKGFSPRNLQFMTQFYEAYQDLEIAKLPVSQIPWRSNILILQSVQEQKERLWYAAQVVKEGWSKNLLMNKIGTLTHQRSVMNKTSNFKLTLSKSNKDVIDEMIKDPYMLTFISANDFKRERDFEKMMVANLSKLLLELGKGFAYVGEQYHIEVEGKDYYIDLLFYNIDLRRYFVVELKPGEFKPEYAGQLNFYVSAIDSFIKREDDASTIGIIICRDKHKLTAEFALKNINSPIGVVEYNLFEDMPNFLSNHLPSIKEIESKIKLIKKSKW